MFLSFLKKFLGRCNSFAIAGLACVLMPTFSAASDGEGRLKSAGDLFEVVITGTGPSAEAARNDAIRQALQKVVPQIIAADRLIKNDEILLDRVMSSMNGHIRSVEVLSVNRYGNEVQSTVKAKISPRDIENYIALRAGPASQLDGAGLLQEALRDKEGREFRDEYIGRALRGYPSSVIKAQIVSIKPDSFTPSTLLLTINVALNSSFVKSIRVAAQDVACVGLESNCSNYDLCTEISGRRECTRLGAGGHVPGYGRYEDEVKIKYYRSLVDVIGTSDHVSARIGRLGGIDFIVKLLDGDEKPIFQGNCSYDLLSQIAERRPKATGPIAWVQRGQAWYRTRDNYTFSDAPQTVEARVPMAALGSKEALTKTKLIEVTPVLVQFYNKQIVRDVSEPGNEARCISAR